MAAVKRKRRASPVDTCQRQALSCIGFIFFCLAAYVALTVQDVATTAPPPQNRRQAITQKFRHTVVQKRQQLIGALQNLKGSDIPVRVQRLRERNEIVGERLKDIQEGTETVQEVLGVGGASDSPPMEIDEILTYLDSWIHQLHDALQPVRLLGFEIIWKAYHDLTLTTLFPWDQEYLSRMPKRRDDGSIFLSLASYRDENCVNTLNWAYGNASNPEKLFTGLVQQNCVANCRTGVLVGGKMDDTDADMDCHKEFCKANPSLCGNIRGLFIDEAESLGPYAARFFASKLWFGESWYLQIDAHMTFLKDWDAVSIQMLKAAPTAKPVLSHYPPGHTMNLAKMAKEPTQRLCGPVFAGSEIESQIVRLEGSAVSSNSHSEYCRFTTYALLNSPALARLLFHRNTTKSRYLLLASLPLQPLDIWWRIPTFYETFHSIPSCHGFSWAKKSSCRVVCGRLATISSLHPKLCWDTCMCVVTNQSFGSRLTAPFTLVWPTILRGWSSTASSINSGILNVPRT